MIAEECFNAISEDVRLFSVDVEDQGRAVSVAIGDDYREFVEAIRVSVGFELLGKIAEWSIKGCHSRFTGD
jgi:hypothetical protein